MRKIMPQGIVKANLSRQKIESQFLLTNLERFKFNLNSCGSQLVDIHREHGTRFHYIHINSSKMPVKVHLSEYEPVSKIMQNIDFGLLVRAKQNEKNCTIWLPPTTVSEISLDDRQRISFYQNTYLSYKWEFQPKFQLSVHGSRKEGVFFVIPYIVFEDNHGDIFQEFKETNEFERRLYRKSDWFYAKTPSDIWNYLIDGSLYDPRCDKSINKRFKCQQCAFAWWNYFGFLHQKTAKRFYSIIQDEVAFSVLTDMASKGEWGHGYWSDEIETHARFHLDGIHLLICQYEKTSDSVWIQAAEIAMEFVFKNLTDQLNDNYVWFLHDTIEPEGKHHFDSTLFGKSPDNSLTINTHVQALTVLYRLAKHVPRKEIYSSMFENGCQALHLALNHRPAEILYKLMSFWILKNKVRKKNHLIIKKIVKAIENRILIKIYWQVQRLFPRLVHTNGFIERDLTLSFASDRYHLINLKDLLLLYQQTKFNWLRPTIEKSFDNMMKFIDDLGLDNAIKKSQYFIETIDILNLYNNRIKSLQQNKIEQIEEIILNHTGGYSLDYYASDLLRKISSS